MITYNIDVSGAKSGLAYVDQQLPYAVSRTLNDIAILAADAQRAHMRSAFRIRNEGVLKYGIARTKQATKQDLVSEVGVSQKMAGAREAFGYLKRFEKGVPKHPLQGTTVGVPNPLQVRRTGSGAVPAPLKIANLGLQKRGTRVLGDRRTFMIKPKSGSAAALILRRTGKLRTVVLWVLERQTPTPAKLRFEDTVTRAVRGMDIAGILSAHLHTALRDGPKGSQPTPDLALARLRSAFPVRGTVTEGDVMQILHGQGWRGGR